MEKPNWKNAPEWANYVAMDGDGSWFWFQDKPVLCNDDVWRSKTGLIENANLNTPISSTLEKRPNIL